MQAGGKTRTSEGQTGSTEVLETARVAIVFCKGDHVEVRHPVVITQFEETVGLTLRFGLRHFFPQ